MARTSSTSAHRLGGTVVIMEKFTPEGALDAIERYGVTDSQWVPTHFVRMLKLPEEERARHDLSSHQRAIHAAANASVADMNSAMRPPIVAAHGRQRCRAASK